MMGKLERASIGGLALVGLLAASCRGCLETDVEFADGSGGAPGMPSSQNVASSGSLATSDASSSVSGTIASSGADVVSTGAGSSAESSADSSSSSASTGTGITCPTDDPFDDALVPECWGFINHDFVTEGTSGVIGDELVVIPDENAGWWDDDAPPDATGWFLFQEVEGPFVVSVHVAVEADKGQFQMGGLLIRQDVADLDAPQAWLKWEIGRRGTLKGQESAYGSIAAGNRLDQPARWIFEQDQVFAINTQFVGRLGICRNANFYVFASQVDGGSWVVDHDFEAFQFPDRVPELPSQVQVGLLANSYNSVPSVTARFNDFIIAAEVATELGQCLDFLRAQSPDPE